MLEEYFSDYNPKKDFTTLVAWKNARQVKNYFYKIILHRIHSEEKFILANQIRRTLNSITANIAEGYGRYYYKEGIQFYRISRASLYELKDHLITCFDLKYIDKEIFNEGIKLIEQDKITLNGFIYYTQNRSKNS